MKHLYIGNLDLGTTEAVVRTLLAPFGDVVTVTLRRDRRTGKDRPFAFAEMNDADAARAIRGLNERTIGSRRLHVTPACPPRLQ